MNQGNEQELRKVGEEALKIHKQMKRQIDSIANKCINFTCAYDWKDYNQEAFIAVYDALLRFSLAHTVHDSNKGTRRESQMQQQTFAQWFIQKRLFKMADVREVCYNVYDKDNVCIAILTNSEYRKNKKELEAKGYTIHSTRNTYHFSELASTREGKIIEFDPAQPEPETEEEVIGWIKKQT